MGRLLAGQALPCPCTQLRAASESRGEAPGPLQVLVSGLDPSPRLSPLLEKRNRICRQRWVTVWEVAHVAPEELGPRTGGRSRTPGAPGCSGQGHRALRVSGRPQSCGGEGPQGADAAMGTRRALSPSQGHFPKGIPELRCRGGPS